MKPSVQVKPSPNVTSEDPDSNKVSRKRRRTRAVVAVVAVLMVALVGVAAGLTVTYIMKNEQSSIHERVYNTSLDGTDVSVKVVTDPKAKIAVLTDGTTTIVGEYNKGFTVYTTPTKDGELTCFIRLMDNTTANFNNLQALTESSASAPQNKEITTVERIVGEKIKDVTFLSTYAQQACAGHNTYWVTPYESQSRGVTKRSDCYICTPGMCFTNFCVPMRCFFICDLPVYLYVPLYPHPDPGPLVNIQRANIVQYGGK